MSKRPPMDRDFRGATGHRGRVGGSPDALFPFSLRFTLEERKALEERAGNVPLAQYIRSQLLNGNPHPRRKYRKPVADDQALAKLLGELGNARLANNLNQLAKHANSGSLPVTPEVEEELRQACLQVAMMRALLLTALGLKGGES